MPVQHRLDVSMRDTVKSPLEVVGAFSAAIDDLATILNQVAAATN
jgi:hypothetical protein